MKYIASYKNKVCHQNSGHHYACPLVRGSIKKYVDNVPLDFIFSTKFKISTLSFVKTYFYFMCKVSLHLIKRWSSYLNFKSTCIVFEAQPHQRWDVKTRRHGDLCFTAFQSTSLCISHKVWRLTHSLKTLLYHLSSSLFTIVRLA